MVWRRLDHGLRHSVIMRCLFSKVSKLKHRIKALSFSICLLLEKMDALNNMTGICIKNGRERNF
jgi:hypothetical protein